jgi:hypothetical protein
MLHCMGCHLEDGSGAPGKVPSLKDDMRAFLRVTGGREYLIQVPGAAQSALSDGELAEVTNWMLQRFGTGTPPADFAPFTGEEVARYRRTKLVDVAITRERLLEALQRAPENRSPASK